MQESALMGTMIAPAEGSFEERTSPELSVVMPCLNEADTLGTCLEKAFRSIKQAGIDAEVIVADNGSTDGSIEIARKAGARVINVKAKGYGR
jgi:glycosyltransferase involved in cell wall biosynthesis